MNGGFAVRSSALFLRGEDKPLVIGNAPIITRTFPRSLAGVFRESIVSLLDGSRYAEGDLSTSLDNVRTLAANNAGRTFATVVTDLEGELNALGFVSP